jgi:peptidoglycan/xylan/chitin deacetylase (PgdA/CDA1 family)
MFRKRTFVATCAAWCAAVSIQHGQLIAADPVGQTRIARWKEDKTAAFLLMFDDSAPSHWQVALPELVKRNMIATFYINPGKAEYQKFAKKWEVDMLQAGMVLGNHTMTHRGVKNAEHAETEIGDCAKVIRAIAKQAKLISFGQPGVGPNDWNITKEEMDALLKGHRMIDRPPFTGHGAVYHMQTAGQMLALADQAVASKGLEYVVIHGVQRITPDWGYQDFWPLKQEILFALLDGLKERRDKGQLWITDHITAHQYQTERDCAEARVVGASNGAIQVELKCSADPELYDLPLTLVTKVPPAWKTVAVKQAGAVQAVSPVNGEVRFEARPNAGQIEIRPAS